MRFQPLTVGRGLLTLTTMTCMATLVACGGGAAPELNGLSDQIAQVGTELKIDLLGTDADGDQLSYDFRIADLESPSATITQSPSGAGVFRWTPLAADVGQHAVDFTVSDGGNTTRVTINIDVRSAIGSATAPIFRQPLGSGTTLDMVNVKCLELAVVVEDQDTAEVTLALEEGAPTGMTLEQENGQRGTVSWCPTREQESEPRHTIAISADDGENPKVIKNYLIVLRSQQSNCPGAAPVITHTPQNQTTIVDLTIDATVTDDKGLKEEPLFYYSTTNPGTTPNLGPGGMTQISMIHIAGNQYAADVPNPVAGQPAGTTRTLYYVIVADDDDDVNGNCDHSTQSQVYSMVVTSSGNANLPLCAPCSSDAQCGTGDLCTYMGSMGASYCLQACGSGCPSGYACSAGDVYSVDFNHAPQCVPSNGSCTMPTAACIDDSYEDDDNMSQASANAAVAGAITGNEFIDAVLCPKVPQPQFGSKADDDWRQLKFAQDVNIDAYLSGDGFSDIDLQIYNTSGGLVSKSTTKTSDENIIKCLKAGTYYMKVNGFSNARTEYLLDIQTTNMSCSCVDDPNDDDNTWQQARTTSANYSSTGNKICPGNDDWFRVFAAPGKKIIMDMTFTQSNATEDLDFHLYDGPFNDLWPCSYEDPVGCSSTRGQSGSSNEHAEYTVPTTRTCPAGGCEYAVVVRGYNNSSNTYSITIRVQ